MRIQALFYILLTYLWLFLSVVFLLVSHDMEIHSDKTQHKKFFFAFPL